jgi:hypothetical protein
VNVVVAIGERERGPAQPEQRDHLLRLNLDLQEQDLLDGTLGDPARLLWP